MDTERSLVDMTPEEREQCVGMRAQVLAPGIDLSAVILRIADDQAEVQFPTERNARGYYHQSEVIPDLATPRAWMTDGSPPNDRMAR